MNVPTLDTDRYNIFKSSYGATESTVVHAEAETDKCIARKKKSGW
jgi:hypothetical protein